MNIQSTQFGISLAILLSVFFWLQTGACRARYV